MGADTPIQWCDSSVNPIMGCYGCELYPPTSEVLRAIDAAVTATGTQIDSKAMLQPLVEDAVSKLEAPLAGHKNELNNTNIWNLRKLFASLVETMHGKAAADAVTATIRSKLACYAAKLHFNKGADILKPKKVPHKGFAEIFEMVTLFEGSVFKAAKHSDLLGCVRQDAEWKGSLPRMIFVSDMGDAFSTQKHFEFLKTDTVPQFQSDAGLRHLWIWLTKRPNTMAKFSEEIGGFPENVCVMTTVTCADSKNLKRVDDLRAVNAHIRGLSIEPLRERIPPESLNLDGIDWVILGGESGAGKDTPVFHTEWAEELMAHCRKHGVAFFLKQLGRRPVCNGEAIKLKDKHGGEWDEWEQHLRVREFPKAFHAYRSAELATLGARPVKKSSASARRGAFAPIPEEDAAFLAEREKIVEAGLKTSLEVGSAIKEIRDYKDGVLFKASYGSIEDYCRKRWGIGQSQAYRLINHAEVLATLKAQLSPNGRETLLSMPSNERQVRPLTKLKNAEDQAKAWQAAVESLNGERMTANIVDKAVRAAVKAGADLKTLPKQKNADRKVVAVTAHDPVIAPVGPSAPEIAGGTAEESITHLISFLQRGLGPDRRSALAVALQELIQTATNLGLSEVKPDLEPDQIQAGGSLEVAA